MGSGQVDRTFATVLWGSSRDRVKSRVFVGRYGWPRSQGRPSGRLGSERSLRTVESDQEDPAGQVGNARELTAGQDWRNGMRDKGRKGFFRERRCHSVSLSLWLFGGELGNVLVCVCVS